jgi:hypothetical protein
MLKRLDMKLTYRGVSYDRVPTNLEVTEGDILGKYRGQVVRRHCLLQEVSRPEVESVLLHYRGSEYAAVMPKFTPSEQLHQAPAASCPVRLPQLSKLMDGDVRQVHVENMRRNLEMRIQAAQAKGDEHLVSLLQQESNKLWIAH